MAEFFELSLIYKEKPDLKFWQENLALKLEKYIYSGRLSFFNDKVLILNEYNFNELYEYEFSVEAISLFTRDNVLDQIEKLLLSVSEINSHSKFDYAIGNIETNGTFIASNNGSINPSKEMVLKSALLFLPEEKVLNMEINLYHIVLKRNSIVCLFNPRAGILYSSHSDNYKILRESVTR